MITLDNIEGDDEDDFAFGPKKLEDNQDSISSENCYFAKAILYCALCAPCFHLFSLSLINIHSQSHLHINHLDSLALPLTQHYICHKMMFQGRRRQQKSS